MFVRYAFLNAVFLLICLTSFSAAQAQTSVAVLDVDYLMQEAKAAKTLQGKRNKAREKLLSELAKKEDALREKGKKIYESRKDIPEEEFVKKSKEYEAELLEMRKLAQEHKSKFEKASAVSITTLQDFITETAAKIAKDNGYGVVISKRSVIVGETALDITQETLKAMNDNNITIPFEIEE